MKSGKMRNQYVQIISNKLLSIFAITKRYTATSLNQFLGIQGRKKPLVSDDGSPNGDSNKCKIKQLCWVHEIRHNAKLFPFFTSHQKLQKKILSQWRKFYHLAKQYGRDPTEEKKRIIRKTFTKITSQITGFDLLDKQLRLSKKKQDRLLTFLDHRICQFTTTSVNKTSDSLSLSERSVVQQNPRQVTKVLSGI